MKGKRQRECWGKEGDSSEPGKSERKRTKQGNITGPKPEGDRKLERNLKRERKGKEIRVLSGRQKGVKKT